MCIALLDIWGICLKYKVLILGCSNFKQTEILRLNILEYPCTRSRLLFLKLLELMQARSSLKLNGYELLLWCLFQMFSIMCVMLKKSKFHLDKFNFLPFSLYLPLCPGAPTFCYCENCSPITSQRRNLY